MPKSLRRILRWWKHYWNPPVHRICGDCGIQIKRSHHRVWDRDRQCWIHKDCDRPETDGEDALDAINAALEWAAQQAEKEPIECVSVPIAEAIRAGKSVPR